MKSNYKLGAISDSIVGDIKSILDSARSRTAAALNASMLDAYWKIGERIVVEEQGGNMRAEYGTSTLKELSRQLTLKLGKGFSPRNLQNYRQFYLLFPDWAIWNARVPNLTILPSEQELRTEIETQKQLFYLQHKDESV
ncbi:MAG: hypothetical protein K2G59_04790 [Muribaculaceae bacterium]|nr:hypothetical protein [Muribaculaceae bacterium]